MAAAPTPAELAELADALRRARDEVESQRGALAAAERALRAQAQELDGVAAALSRVIAEQQRAAAVLGTPAAHTPAMPPSSAVSLLDTALRDASPPAQPPAPMPAAGSAPQPPVPRAPTPPEPRAATPPPASEALEVKGTPRMGETLVAKLVSGGSLSGRRVSWSRITPDGAESTIEGAAGHLLTLSADELNTQVRVFVAPGPDPSAQPGGSSAAPFGPIAPHDKVQTEVAAHVKKGSQKNGYASFKVARASDLVEAAILVGSSKLKIREGRGWSAKTTHKLAVRELPAPAVVLDRGDERRFSVLLPAGGGALEFVSDHASARDVLALTLRSFAGMSGQSGGMSGQSGHSGSAGGASAARRPGAAGAGGAGGEAPIVGAGVDEDADEEGYMDHRKANDRYADRLARPGGAVRSTRDSGARGSGGDDDDDASTIAPTEDGGDMDPIGWGTADGEGEGEEDFRPAITISIKDASQAVVVDDHTLRQASLGLAAPPPARAAGGGRRGAAPLQLSRPKPEEAGGGGGGGGAEANGTTGGGAADAAAGSAASASGSRAIGGRRTASFGRRPPSAAGAHSSAAPAAGGGCGSADAAASGADGVGARTMPPPSGARGARASDGTASLGGAEAGGGGGGGGGGPGASLGSTVPASSSVQSFGSACAAFSASAAAGGGGACASASLQAAKQFYNFMVVESVSADFRGATLARHQILGEVRLIPLSNEAPALRFRLNFSEASRKLIAKATPNPKFLAAEWEGAADGAAADGAAAGGADGATALTKRDGAAPEYLVSLPARAGADGGGTAAAAEPLPLLRYTVAPACRQIPLRLLPAWTSPPPPQAGAPNPAAAAESRLDLRFAVNPKCASGLTHVVLTTKPAEGLSQLVHAQPAHAAATPLAWDASTRTLTLTRSPLQPTPEPLRCTVDFGRADGAAGAGADGPAPRGGPVAAKFAASGATLSGVDVGLDSEGRAAVSRTLRRFVSGQCYEAHVE